MNNKLPFYLIKEIIFNIINYLLVNNNNKIINNNEIIKYKNYCSNYYEIIDYSLVCKHWFNYCSSFISNLIENNNNLEEWIGQRMLISIDTSNSSNLNKYSLVENNDFYNLKSIRNINSFVTQYSTDSKFFKINRSKWSLIKIKKEIIRIYFENYLIYDYIYSFNSDFIFDLNQKLNNKLVSRVKIRLNFIEHKNVILNFLFYDKELNENLSIKLLFYNRREESTFNDGINKLTNFKQSIKYLDKLTIRGSFPIPINFWNFIKPKSLNIDDTFFQDNAVEMGFLNVTRFDYSAIFDILNDNLEHLIIKDQSWIEPIQLININHQLKNLKTLSFLINWHFYIKSIYNFNVYQNERNKNNNMNDQDMLTLVRNQSSNSCETWIIERFIYSINLVKEWNEMIETITNNQTIINLSIGSICNIKNCDTDFCSDLYNFEKQMISNSLNYLLTNKKTIQYLRFVNLQILDCNSLQALLYNQTIKILEFKECFELAYGFDWNFKIETIEYLFSNIFNNDINPNSGIQRFKFIIQPKIFGGKENRNYSHWEVLINFINKYPNSNLYSIGLPFKIGIDNLNLLFNLFLSPITKLTTIKEFIIYPFYNWFDEKIDIKMIYNNMFTSIHNFIENYLKLNNIDKLISVSQYYRDYTKCY